MQYSNASIPLLEKVPLDPSYHTVFLTFSFLSHSFLVAIARSPGVICFPIEDLFPTSLPVMYGYSNSNDQADVVPRTFVAARPNLPPIEEKEGDVEYVEHYISPARYPRKSRFSPTVVDEKYARFTETPSPLGMGGDRDVLRDKFGFPLSPQPLDDEKDPLTWSNAVKYKILIQISLHSFLSHFSAFAIVSSVHAFRRYSRLTYTVSGPLASTSIPQDESYRDKLPLRSVPDQSRYRPSNMEPTLALARSASTSHYWPGRLSS